MYRSVENILSFSTFFIIQKHDKYIRIHVSYNFFDSCTILFTGKYVMVVHLVHQSTTKIQTRPENFGDWSRAQQDVHFGIFKMFYS